MTINLSSNVFSINTYHFRIASTIIQISVRHDCMYYRYGIVKDDYRPIR